MAQTQLIRQSIVAVVSLLILGTVIGAFFLIGSPYQQRLIKLDQQRADQLSQIRYAVDAYFQSHQGVLPDSLETLRANTSYSYLPAMDTETNTPYEYTKTGDLTFQLCATFSLDSNELLKQRAPYFGPVEFSKHPVGRTCFPLAESPFQPLPIPPSKPL